MGFGKFWRESMVGFFLESMVLYVIAAVRFVVILGVLWIN